MLLGMFEKIQGVRFVCETVSQAGLTSRSALCRYEGGVIMIKGGCIEGLDWTGGIHIFTKHAVWPIPEDAEQYEGAPP